MIITNSLGSNYTRQDRRLAAKLLLCPWKWKKGPESRLLAKKLNGRLFLKGRQAITQALGEIGVGPGDEVIVQAFTCVAVVQPILDLRAIPVYVDITKRTLNPSLQSIKSVTGNKTKAVILQHTLGVVNPEADKIVSWCKTKGITVIQDLAHAFGGPTSEVLHTCKAIVSFSQDKVIDGVAGGALISIDQPKSFYSNDLNHWSVLRLLLYPIVTHLIRSTYNVGLGKVVHFTAKNLGLLNSPIDAGVVPQAMPNALAVLVLSQLDRFKQTSDHRKFIARQYDKILSDRIKILNKMDIENGTNLRYPIWAKNRVELEQRLKDSNFYLLDHWYDAPVSPSKMAGSSGYRKESCPNAENLSRYIFNLPTHVNISGEKAIELANLVNRYAKI